MNLSYYDEEEDDDNIKLKQNQRLPFQMDKVTPSLNEPQLSNSLFHSTIKLEDTLVSNSTINFDDDTINKSQFSHTLNNNNNRSSPPIKLKKIKERGQFEGPSEVSDDEDNYSYSSSGCSNKLKDVDDDMIIIESSDEETKRKKKRDDCSLIIPDTQDISLTIDNNTMTMQIEDLKDNTVSKNKINNIVPDKDNNNKNYNDNSSPQFQSKIHKSTNHTDDTSLYSYHELNSKLREISSIKNKKKINNEVHSSPTRLEEFVEKKKIKLDDSTIPSKPKTIVKKKKQTSPVKPVKGLDLDENNIDNLIDNFENNNNNESMIIDNDNTLSLSPISKPNLNSTTTNNRITPKKPILKESNELKTNDKFELPMEQLKENSSPPKPSNRKKVISAYKNDKNTNLSNKSNKEDINISNQKKKEITPVKKTKIKEKEEVEKEEFIIPQNKIIKTPPRNTNRVLKKSINDDSIDDGQDTSEESPIKPKIKALSKKRHLKSLKLKEREEEEEDEILEQSQKEEEEDQEEEEEEEKEEVIEKPIKKKSIKPTIKPSNRKVPTKSSKSKSNNELEYSNSIDDMLPVRYLEPIFKGYTFILTSSELKDDEKEIFYKQIKEYGGKVSIDESFFLGTRSSGKKYCLSNNYQTTVKYLKSVLTGIECVNVEWISECVKENQLIDIEDYILPSGFSLIQNQLVNVRPKGPIFDSTSSRFEIIGSDIFIKHWQSILKMCGGRAVKRLGNSGKIDYVLVEGASHINMLLHNYTKSSIPVVPTRFVIECILNKSNVSTLEMDEDVKNQLFFKFNLKD